MIVLELEEVEIDHCLKCGGIWLDSGELEMLLIDADERDDLLTKMSIDESSSEKIHKCPICLKKNG
jgi:Zn-finger nucleic acid-binding protein